MAENRFVFDETFWLMNPAAAALSLNAFAGISSGDAYFDLWDERAVLISRDGILTDITGATALIHNSDEHTVIPVFGNPNGWLETISTVKLALNRCGMAVGVAQA